jgi:hypothetical protein
MARRVNIHGDDHEGVATGAATATSITAVAAIQQEHLVAAQSNRGERQIELKLAQQFGAMDVAAQRRDAANAHPCERGSAGGCPRGAYDLPQMTPTAKPA